MAVTQRILYYLSRMLFLFALTDFFFFFSPAELKLIHIRKYLISHNNTGCRVPVCSGACGPSTSSIHRGREIISHFEVLCDVDQRLLTRSKQNLGHYVLNDGRGRAVPPPQPFSPLTKLVLSRLCVEPPHRL